MSSGIGAKWSSADGTARHPFAPANRYELWLRASDGAEHKSTVHTRKMPARRGYEVGLTAMTHRRPRVLAAGFAGMTAWLGDAGMVLFLPGAVVMLVAVAAALDLTKFLANRCR